MPTAPGVAVNVADCPWQTVGLFTVTVGHGSNVTTPEALTLTQPVTVSVITTL